MDLKGAAIAERDDLAAEYGLPIVENQEYY